MYSRTLELSMKVSFSPARSSAIRRNRVFPKGQANELTFRRAEADEKIDTGREYPSSGWTRPIADGSRVPDMRHGCKVLSEVSKTK